MKKDKHWEPLVPLVGCFGCGMRIGDRGGLCAVVGATPCQYRDRGVADRYGTAEIHPPFQVTKAGNSAVAVHIFDYAKGKQIKVPGVVCNISAGQAGQLRPYPCNDFFRENPDLRLDDLIRIGKAEAKKGQRRGKKKRTLETEAEAPEA